MLQKKYFGVFCICTVIGHLLLASGCGRDHPKEDAESSDESHLQNNTDDNVPTSDASHIPESDDAQKPDDPIVTEPDLPETLQVTITAPVSGTMIEQHTPVDLQGALSGDNLGHNALSIEWRSDRDGVLAQLANQDPGNTAATIQGLTAGWHTLSLYATTAHGLTQSSNITLGVCEKRGPSSTFDHDLNSNSPWHIYGDAYWDPQGWLEMTGIEQSHKGAIFNIVEQVSADRVTIAFRIATGGGTGADGFAMSVIGARSVQELEALIAAATVGGGLGYAYAENYPTPVPALHIEFDTWENKIVPNGDLFDDPTPSDHIAVTLDGDPGSHVLWAPIDDLEDNQWHDVLVSINGDSIDVKLDGITRLSGDVPHFHFKGGYIGFTGTTGYYTNSHRIDDLSIPCLVP